MTNAWRMGDTAAADTYDPMTGVPIGVPSTYDPREDFATAPWARAAMVHPEAYEPLTSKVFPDYKPPDETLFRERFAGGAPTELPSVGTPAIPSGPTWQGSERANRAADVAEGVGRFVVNTAVPHSATDLGLMLTPGGFARKAIGGAIGSVFDSDEAQAGAAGALKKLLTPGAKSSMGEILRANAAEVMKYGQAPQGSFANWILRYDPGTGAPNLFNETGKTGHAYSGLKTGLTPAEMTHTIAGEPALLPYAPIDMAKLKRQKAEIVFGPTDKMYGGGNLTHVGETELRTPVPQEGGLNFSQMHAGKEIPDIPPDAAPLYASVSKGAASKSNNAAQAVLERGGVPYYAPVIMGPGGGNSTKQVANTVHQLLRQAEPNEAAIAAIDKAISTKALAADLKDYPGFADEAKLQAWLDRGLAERRALTEGTDTKPVRAATGVDVGHAVISNTDPRLLHTPSGSFGSVLGRMRPDVGVSAYPLHSNYPITFFGQRGEIGGMPGNIPFALGAPDVHRALVPVRSPSGGSAATTPAMQVMRGGTKVQPVTQEVVDNFGEWFRRHPQGWAAAGGVPILGGLAASDKYQPEERM